MATVTNYELDFNLKSEDDLKIILEKLKDFFTYDYIGENCYKVKELNLKMDISYLSNEEECSFAGYFANSYKIELLGMNSGYEILCENLKDIIKMEINAHKVSPDNIYIEGLSFFVNSEINSFKKYLLMMDILDMLDTFSIKFWEYCVYENGKIIEDKREYFNIITETNYK